MIRSHTHRIIFLLCIGVLLFGLVSPAAAQQDEKIQVIEEIVHPSELDYYNLINLKRGDTLYVFAENLSGYVDPLIMLLKPGVDPNDFLQLVAEEQQRLLDANQDPLDALSNVAQNVTLVWDDDSGPGYSAQFTHLVTQTDNLLLLVTSRNLDRSTGSYKLTLGVNAPQVLEGNARSTGDTIAVLNSEFTSKNQGTQIYTPTLDGERPQITLPVLDMEADDTLYVHVRTSAGDLRPSLVLRDYGGKVIKTANINGASTVTALQYTAVENIENYKLTLSACCNFGPESLGKFEIIVGVNTPEVLQGNGQPGGRQVLRLPIDVKTGIRLQQITAVDQIAENFSAVATLRMEWQDPAMAFNPDECNCDTKIYQDTNFNDFLKDVDNLWPSFTIFNQQGNRWVQNRAIAISPDGSAVYLERFWTILQAPDFDFTRFPFDTQKFFIRVDTIYPDTYYNLVNDETFTEVGATLGEEEWFVINQFTEESSETISSTNPVSRYSFGFEVSRHLDYYIYRLFVPISLIIIVSWFTFFLKDYSKRVDATSANLLVFVAYNFTIANDLPRLGYLTFMDTILLAAFVISVGTVLYTVILRRYVEGPHGERLKKIDSVLIWAYPLLYLGTFALLIVRVI